MDKSVLDIYTDCLIGSFSRTTATGLGRLPDGSISHGQVTRSLPAEPKTSA